MLKVVAKMSSLLYNDAQQRSAFPESVLMALISFRSIFSSVFRPVTLFVSSITHGVLRIVGLQRKEDAAEQIKQEIIEAIKKGESEGVLEDDERSLIEGILKFKDVLVSDIMTQRTDIISVDLSTPVEEVLRIASAKGHWRIPVHVKHRDTIEGVLYLRDILPSFCASGRMPESVQEVMRKPLFVPATKKISTLLREFRRTKQQLAIVIDEYGGTAGLVTIEDIIEEIVGEIPGRLTKEFQLEFVDSHTFQASGRTRTEDINSKFNLNLPEGDGFETLGGLLARAHGKIPKPGDTHYYEGVSLKVIDADERRVKKVQITLPEEAK
jgi:putative hemolysin